jgi:hypothetical protein
MTEATCPKCGESRYREYESKDGPGSYTFWCGTTILRGSHAITFSGHECSLNVRIQELTAQLAAKDEQLAERERELDYFLNDVYEFGCCQFDLCASDEDHKRTMGLIWQRVCILKEAVKHGCKLPAPQQGTQA